MIRRLTPRVCWILLRGMLEWVISMVKHGDETYANVAVPLPLASSSLLPDLVKGLNDPSQMDVNTTMPIHEPHYVEL